MERPLVLVGAVNATLRLPFPGVMVPNVGAAAAAAWMSVPLLWPETAVFTVMFAKLASVRPAVFVKTMLWVLDQFVTARVPVTVPREAKVRLPVPVPRLIPLVPLEFRAPKLGEMLPESVRVPPPSVTAFEPMALAFEIVRPPALMVTPPEKLLGFAKVSVPAPDLVSAPEPVMLPENVFVPASATVRVWLAAIETLPPVVPPPCREPMVSLVDTVSRTPAVFARLIVPESLIAVPLAWLRVNPPALTVVVPEYVFVPLRVSVPEPVFVKPPEPEITPEKVPPEVWLAVRVTLEATDMLPPVLPPPERLPTVSF